MNENELFKNSNVLDVGISDNCIFVVTTSRNRFLKGNTEPQFVVVRQSLMRISKVALLLNTLDFKVLSLEEYFHFYFEVFFV